MTPRSAARTAVLAALLPLLAGGGTARAETALVIPHLAGPVLLDGALEEPAWRQAARLTRADFQRWVARRATRDPDEFSVRLFHDGRSLYVAVAFYDRYVEPAATPESADGLYAFSVLTADGRLKHYRLRWSANPPQPGGDMLDLKRFGARLRGPYADPSHPGGGYVFEFAIPLTSIGWRPGGTGRLNIILQDHDGMPGAPFDDMRVDFTRFAYGGFDNDTRAVYRTVRLAP